jgi:glycerate-2-kinase
MSFLEIYNEQLLDRGNLDDHHGSEKSLKLSGNSVVTGFTKNNVPNVQAGLELVQ